MTHRKILYWLAFSDGLALLALVFVAVPFKYLLDQPLGVKVLGPLHGTLFLSLAVTTLAALGRGLLRPGLRTPPTSWPRRFRPAPSRCRWCRDRRSR